MEGLNPYQKGVERRGGGDTTSKTLLLQLEVGMRFYKSFHNESSVRCCVVQILSVGNLSELFERNVARTLIMVIKRLGIESL